MAEKKRQCGTCRFFAKTEASGHGRCTHPKRVGTAADLLLLRPTELACRTEWGSSLWQDPADDSDPMEPKTPQQPTLPEPIAAQMQFDDEVTSVSIAGSKSSRSTFEDDVVDSGATATGMASWNDPLQDERLDLLRKGSHDALAGARKRHMEKQARQREMVPFAEDEDASASDSQQNEEQSTLLSEPVVEAPHNFPPDDFVETERTSAEDQSSPGDEMVDEGVTPERNRTPRLRKLLRDPHDPKRNEAMRMSVPSEMRVTSHNPEQREQWNSVPTLNPSFELPLNQSDSRPTSTPVKLTASAAPVTTASYQPRPVSQARELLSEDRLRQERAQRQLVAPLHDEPAHMNPGHIEPGAISRSKLTEAPAQDATPIEQIKSSPLRGYHPATRKLMQPQQPEQEQAHVMREPQAQQAPVGRMVTQPRSGNPESPIAYDASPRTQQSSRPISRVRNQEYHPQSADRSEARKQESQSRSRVEEKRRPYIHLRQDGEPFRHLPLEISPKVPRNCGTCRDYRPSGVEGRGSCMNEFAGPVQRVVYEEDLACQHTYGSLWIPADDRVWSSDLPDTSAPTPRVDAMLARKRRREITTLPDLDELTS